VGHTITDPANPCAGVRWGVTEFYTGAHLIPDGRRGALCLMPVDEWHVRVPVGRRVCPECAVLFVSALFTEPEPAGRSADEKSVARLAVSLQSNLNHRNVDGLLQFAQGGAHAVGSGVRAQLVLALPLLDPAHPDHDAKVYFGAARITASNDRVYRVRLTGRDIDAGQLVSLVFTVRVLGAVATWSEVRPG
jgi:hypothetical protein